MRTAGRSPLAAYTELYRVHHHGLLRYASGLTGGDRWRAEDLVAEAHLRVWRRLADGHRIEDPRAYLATTVRHLAALPVRERVVGELPDEGGAEAADPAPRVAETDRMRGLLAQLPERWAQALWLSEVEGLPPGEVGDRLGMGRGAAAVLLHRAREGLRLAYLRAYPGAPRDPGCSGHWAALAGQARGRAGRRVQRHLADCADCRGRLALLRRVNLRLAGLVGSAAALAAALVCAPFDPAERREAVAVAAAGCEVRYRVTSETDDRFTARIALRNTSDRPVAGWTLRWPLPVGEHLLAAWPGTGEGYEEGTAGAAIRDGGWNAVLPPGASTVTGYTGSWAHPHPVPESITLNGRPCRVKVW
ncbi:MULTISPECIES: cellulose binding domain-containing protein [Kitasatospora]|uniref:Putative RNA polymerase ECF subfamily sigma factor n=1 Tax=Kitasatospora setae (strain ATCC 33774 / DSM 43861 / JCM 3304 / KCC A-0304 / NBRC 14216 / KM-6054) TaxID=452652 RepID=E4NBU1_KITSK|nr:cellulose binding domain-containing protein [Kitasatospora setae]BAJ28672.1 putative RNA polymerase ECF subfamily sigma factor [Kitasatospora setae KM-6054]